MTQLDPNAADPHAPAAAPLVVVAGYGLPGRSLVDLVRSRGCDYRVIELNPMTCQRAAIGGTHIIEGDAADPHVLRLAGVERATLLALMVPNDDVVLAAIRQARVLNPSVHIIARCAFTSTGLEATRLGADQIIVAEQLVAHAVSHLAEPCLPR